MEGVVLGRYFRGLFFVPLPPLGGGGAKVMCHSYCASLLLS